MSDQIFFDGQRYISAADASAATDLSRDYIARLCRENKVRGKRIGKNWYVDEQSLTDFVTQQERVKAERRELLSEERAKEYVRLHETMEKISSAPRAEQERVDRAPVLAKASEHVLVLSPITKTLAAHALEAQSKLKSKALEHTESAMRFAPSVLATPSGVHEAVVRTIGHTSAHVPVYTLTPFAEFIQKFIALIVAFTMTFGTYALVDPTYARFAMDSLRDTGSSIAQSYRDVTGGGISKLAARSHEKMLFAAENPNAALAQVSSASLAFIPDSLRSIARNVNSSVDHFIYAIAFPDQLTGPYAVAVEGGANVSVEVAPYTRASKLAAQQTTGTSSDASVADNSSQSLADPITIIERHIETERIVAAAGGITEEYLDQKLAALESRLSSRLIGSSAGGSAGYTTINNNYQLIAQSNNIDKLGSVTIESSTITGGTISGTAISDVEITGSSFAGSVAATTLSASATSSLATTTITGDLTISGDTTIEGTLTIPGAISISSSTIDLLTNTYATTSVLSAVTASTTDLTWVNASGTNATTTNFFSTNASTTNATSTNIFASVARFTAGFLGNITSYGEIAAPWFNATSTTATSTFAGGILGTRIPTVPHTFASWTIGVSDANPFDASLVINPASAAGDTNLIAAAVGGSTKFLVDAEGDVFLNNLTSVGSVTLSTTTASTFTVEGDATFGDSITDVTTVNGSLIVTGTTTASTIQGNFGVGTTTPWARISIAGAAGATTPLFSISSTTAGYATSTVFHVDSNGRVGVGTTSPSAVFAVNAPIYVGGQGAAATSTFEGNVHVYGILKVGTSSSYVSNSNISSVGDLTVSNATTTNIFSTTASSTNLYASNAQFGALSLLGTLTTNGLSAFTNGFISQASSTVAGNFTATGDASIGNFNMDSTAACGNTFHAFIGPIGTVGGDECAALNVTQQDINGNIIYRFGEANGSWAGEFYANASSVNLNTKTAVPITFQTQGTERVRVASGGNVGIGTVDPQTNLDVVGNTYVRNAAGAVGSNDGVEIATDSSAPRVSLVQGGRYVGLFSADAPGNTYLKNVAGGSLLLYGGSGGNVELARLTNDGYFGIGTTSPWKMLSVAGDAYIGGNLTATGTLAVSGATTLSSTLNVTGNTTLANATSTNLFSTTASSTNLFASAAQFGSLSILGALTQTGLGTFANGFVSQASSTVVGSFTNTGAATFGSTLAASGLATFTSGFVSQASSTVVGNLTSTGTGSFANGAFTGTTGTTTIASGQGFTVGSSQFVVQQGSGNIGIGTTTPSSKLEIGDSANSSIRGVVTNSSNGTVASAQLVTRNGYSSTLSDATRLVTTGTGYTSSGVFQQNGGVLLAGSSLSGGLSIAASNASAALRFYTGGSGDSDEKLRITSSGNIGIGTTSPWAKLAVTGAGTGTGKAFVVADSSNSPKFVVQDNGNVGINDDTPSYALDVGGFINTDGTTGGFKQDGNTILYASSSKNTTLVGVNAGSQALSDSSLTRTTAVGYNALSSASLTGSFNTAFGWSALSGVTSGTGNVGLGDNTGTGITTGTNNVAIAYSLLANGITGTRNIGIGQAMQGGVITGSDNIALGNAALNVLTSGTFNVALGRDSLKSNTTGSFNNVIGGASLGANTTGSSNNVQGYNALASSITGSENVAVGANSSLRNTSATSTTAVGFQSAIGAAAFSAQGYTTLGYRAGFSFATGADYNTLLGYQTGYNITSGQYNTILGYSGTSGGITTGSNNILIGKDVRAGLAVTDSNQLNIGNLLFGSGLGSGTTAGTGNIGIGSTTPFAKLSVKGAGSTTGINFQTTNSSDSPLFTILDSGNVGIGSTTPSAKLVVSGDMFLDGSSRYINFGTAAQGTNGYGFRDNAGTLQIKNSGGSWTDIPTSASGASGTTGQFPYFSADNTLTGTSSLYIATSGKIGIGTTSPAGLLHAYSATAGAWSVVETSGTNVDANLQLQTASGGWVFKTDESDSQKLNIFASNGLVTVTTTPAVVITQTGNVGIGTTSPFRTLSVAGDVGAKSLIVEGSGTYAPGAIYSDSNWGMIFRAKQSSPATADFLWSNSADTHRMLIDPNGRLGINDDSPDFRTEIVGSSGSGYFGITNSTDGDIFTINTSGNVGIGTTTPSEKLTVNGNLRFGSTGAGTGPFVWGTDSNGAYLTEYSGLTPIKTSIVVKGTTGNVGIGTTTPFTKLEVNDEIISGTYKSTGGNIRLIGGSYGAMLRNDGSNLYLLLTSSGDQYGTWNTLRPFTVNVSTGAVTLDSTGAGGASAGGAFTATGDISSNGTYFYGDSQAIVQFSDEWLRLNPSGHFSSGIYAGTGVLRTDGTLQVGASGATFYAASGGNVGIGTTSPYRKLSVTDTVAAAQASIAYDGTRDTQLQTDSSGDFVINPSGDDVRINDDNLWVCAGGSCPAGTPTGNGNLVVESKIGVGNSAPNDALDVAGDIDATGAYKLDGVGIINGVGTDPYGNFRVLQNISTASQDGMFINYNSTGSTAADVRFYANGTTERMRISASNGYVGIGTTSPAQQLGVGGLLFVGANGATGMGTATSTFYGDIKIIGKLDVSTIDPPYTIDGVKWATYVPSMTGVKEETTQVISLAQKDASGKYAYTISFDKVEKGSDLWLFYQITDFGASWQHLTVLLTPSFDGTVFYKKVPEKNQLIVYADAPGEVSMRLTGNRYDFSKWPNLRPDQDGDTAGTHVISSKPLSAPEGVNIADTQ